MEKLAAQPDTADDVMIELTRGKSPAELTLMASRLFCSTRDRLRAFLEQTHPTWTPEQIHAELLRRIHGSE